MGLIARLPFLRCGTFYTWGCEPLAFGISSAAGYAPLWYWNPDYALILYFKAILLCFKNNCAILKIIALFQKKFLTSYLYYDMLKLDAGIVF